MVDEIFLDATTAKLYVTTRLRKILEQNHSSTFMLCQEQVLTSSHLNPLLFDCPRPSLRPSVCFLAFFTVSRAAGTRWRGEECSVLPRSFACTSVP